MIGYGLETESINFAFRCLSEKDNFWPEVQTGRAGTLLRHLVPKLVTNGGGIFHLQAF